MVKTGFVMTIKDKEAKRLIEAFDKGCGLNWHANDDGSLELYID